MRSLSRRSQLDKRVSGNDPESTTAPGHVTPRLSAKILGRLPDSVVLPKFAPADLHTGILHLGCGSFHRAHQALATQQAMNEGHDLRWGIASVAMHNRSVVDALRSQNNLYSTLLRDTDEVHAEVVGAITETVHAPSDPMGVPERIADSRIKLVTLTVTAGGYCIFPTSGCLDPDSEQVRHDLKYPTGPTGTIGMITHGLDLVRRRGGCWPMSARWRVTARSPNPSPIR